MRTRPVERASDRLTAWLTALLFAASLLPNGSTAASTPANTAAGATDAVAIAGKTAPPPGDAAPASVNVECRRPSPARQRGEPPGPRLPDKGPVTTALAPLRITVACVDGDTLTSETSTPASNRVAPPPTGPAPAGSTSSVASLVSNLDPRGEQTSRPDWNLLVPAALSKLVALVLAIACGILAYAAWRVLHLALAGPAGPASPSGPRPGNEAFAFQRHWGGFGGSSTGWTVSERLVRVIVGLALAALAVSLGMQLVAHEAGRDDKAKPGPEAAASAAKPGK
jgi:hypothetical protein